MNRARLDRDNERRRARRAADPDTVRAKDRAAYGEAKKARVAAWRAANPEKVKATNKASYERHKIKTIAAVRARMEANPEKVREYARRGHARRQATDPAYRLNRSIRAHVQYSLAGAKNGQKWERLVGYTLGDLIPHIERQFLSGMTWANYGDWHVDHIRPLASFTFASPADDQFREAWALTNLRPLWALDNLTKRDRRTHLI